MRITNVLFGLLLLLCVACDKSEKETPSGLKFKVVKAGDGILPKAEEVLVFNYLFKDSKDSVWTDTFKEDFPAAILIADSAAIPTENGMVQMLRMVSKGDSITMGISIKDFFKDMLKGPVPPGFDTTLMLSYSIKVNAIMSRDSFMAFQNEFMMKQQAVQFEKDIAAIDAYLTGKGIVAEKTESGLRYVITKPGIGENGKSGQVAKVNYTGYMLDGQYFDSSDKSVAEQKGIYDARREPYTPYDVTIDQTSVIKGWHEALKLMNKGSKATVYVPSSLAYGPQQRSEIIKPNSVLVFDLEVVDLK
jgi:FKBP-type peptidyl-prolyl cis-trans isomerase